MALVAFLAFGVVGVRLFQLQVVEPPNPVRWRIEPLRGGRGLDAGSPDAGRMP